MTMGTASTMASMVEAIGMTLPTAAAIPAVDSRRYTLAHLTGFLLPSAMLFPLLGPT